MYRQGTTPRAGRRRRLQHVPSNAHFESEDRLAYSTVTGSAPSGSTVRAETRVRARTHTDTRALTHALAATPRHVRARMHARTQHGNVRAQPTLGIGRVRWLGLSSVAEWAAPYWACLSALESARATGLAWAAAMEALMAFSSAAAWAYRLAPVL